MATKSVVVSRPKRYYQCYLTGPLPRDSGFNYIFGIIDVSTKELFTAPLKNKTASETAKALAKIVDDNDLEFSVIQSDNGDELAGQFAALLKKKKLHLPISQGKRIFKSKMDKSAVRCRGTQIADDSAYAYVAYHYNHSDIWNRCIFPSVDQINRDVMIHPHCTANDEEDLLDDILKPKYQSQVIAKKLGFSGTHGRKKNPTGRSLEGRNEMRLTITHKGTKRVLETFMRGQMGIKDRYFNAINFWAHSGYEVCWSIVSEVLEATLVLVAEKRHICLSYSSISDDDIKQGLHPNARYMRDSMPEGDDMFVEQMSFINEIIPWTRN